MGGRRLLVTLIASFAGALALAAPTQATFHFMLLREVYPGTGSSPEAEYVELQMYSSGQELVKNHQVHFFDAGGGSLGSVSFDDDVARGVSQSTIVLATPAAESEFGIAADKEISGDKLKAAGGAVCWEELDCVAWGSFSGSLPSPAGSPADPAGIPDGMALRRTIAPGCPTQLEAGDDSDDSATDFADASPEPRPNSVEPSERSCAGQGGQAGGGKGQAGGGDDAPRTRLTRRPPRRTADRTPTFRFAATPAGATFFCKLDGRPFKRCRSPFTAPRLSLGRHVFRVKARTQAGGTDRSPAIWRFKVVGSQ